MWNHSSVMVVGHPGHELRVHGWMEIAHPTVCVLTDGSGSAGPGRLGSTSRVLERTGASPGPIFGRMSDREFYSAILNQDLAFFQNLADEVCAVLVASKATCVVGDAIEGYNPSHDVCRLVINAAVRMANRAMRADLLNFDFVLVGRPDEVPETLRNTVVRFSLDDEGVARKLASAHAYPELAEEVSAALERLGPAAFQHEVLRPVDIDDPYGWPSDKVPFYETYGEKRVAEGVYRDVLRFREHIVPLAEALWNHSTREA